MTSIVDIVHEVEDDYKCNYDKIPQNEPRLVKVRQMLSLKDEQKKLKPKPLRIVDHKITPEERQKIHEDWLNLKSDHEMAIDMKLTFNQVANARSVFGKPNKLIWKFTKDGDCIRGVNLKDFKETLKLSDYTNTDWVVERAEKLGYKVEREMSHDY